MAPRTIRSRACNECRKRRVKCDETALYCKQCMRLGLLCSGPVEGVLILDMTKKVSSKGKKPRKGKKSKSEDGASSSKDEPTDDATSSASTPKLSKKQTESAIDNDHLNEAQLVFRPSSDNQLSFTEQLNFEPLEPSQSSDFDLHEQMFISQFVDLISSKRPYQSAHRPKSWLHALPDIVSKTKIEALKYSVRAAAMAHYAFVYGDMNMKAESCRWYIAGLESQRQMLMDPVWDSESSTFVQPHDPLPSCEKICIPLMLAAYELVSRTTPAGWFQHIMAATKMVEMRGPDNCRMGIEHSMFRSLRVFSAFISILRIERSPFEDESWCSLPFSGKEKSPWDTLIDILLSLPRFMSLFENTNSTSLEEFVKNIETADMPSPAINRVFSSLLLRLETWWWDFEKQGVAVDKGPEPDNFAPRRESYYFPKIFIYRDTLTANTIAVYNAACIITHLVLKATVPHGEKTTEHIRHMQAHAASILSVASFEEYKTDGYGDVVRTLFPLRIVAILAPDSNQRAIAWRTLQRWTVDKGLSGAFGGCDGTAEGNVVAVCYPE